MSINFTKAFVVVRVLATSREYTPIPATFLSIAAFGIYCEIDSFSFPSQQYRQSLKQCLLLDNDPIIFCIHESKTNNYLT